MRNKADPYMTHSGEHALLWHIYTDGWDGSFKGLQFALSHKLFN